MIGRKLQNEIDKWESRTHVYVVFCRDYVDVQGEFNDYELSEIASIQRKRLKELRPSLVKSEQRGLFDE